MVAGFVTLHYKAVQEETERNKQGRQRNKENKGRELGRRRGESNEAHRREEERGSDRKAPPQTKGGREGGARGKRGRDKSEILRGRGAGGMQIKAERGGDYNEEAPELCGVNVLLLRQ